VKDTLASATASQTTAGTHVNTIWGAGLSFLSAREKFQSLRRQ